MAGPESGRQRERSWWWWRRPGEHRVSEERTPSAKHLTAIPGRGAHGHGVCLISSRLPWHHARALGRMHAWVGNGMCHVRGRAGNTSLKASGTSAGLKQRTQSRPGLNHAVVSVTVQGPATDILLLLRSGKLVLSRHDLDQETSNYYV